MILIERVAYLTQYSSISNFKDCIFYVHLLTIYTKYMLKSFQSDLNLDYLLAILTTVFYFQCNNLVAFLTCDLSQNLIELNYSG